MAAEKTYNDLDVSLRKANEHRNAWFEGVRKCTARETLYTVMERIVRAEVHRLVITDDDSKVVGIISLSDILLFLVLRPSETSVSASTHNISLRSSELFHNDSNIDVTTEVISQNSDESSTEHMDRELKTMAGQTEIDGNNSNNRTEARINEGETIVVSLNDDTLI